MRAVKSLALLAGHSNSSFRKVSSLIILLLAERVASERLRGGRLLL